MLCNVTHIFSVPLFWDTLVRKLELYLKSHKLEKKFNRFIKFSLFIQKLCPKHGPGFIRKVLFKKHLENVFGSSICFNISGGGTISKKTLRTINGIGYPLFNGYGATEIGIVAMVDNIKIKHRLNGSIGKPFENINFKIEDNELLVTGNCFSKKIMEKTTWKATDKTYKLNDLVYLYKKEYYIKGRSDNCYVDKNGENYNLDAIESEMSLIFCESYSFIVSKDNEVYLILSYPKNILKMQINKDVEQVKKNVGIVNLIKNIYITFKEIPLANGIKIKRKELVSDFYKNKKDYVSYDSFIESKNNKDKEENNDEIMNRILNIFKKQFKDKVVNANSDFYLDLNGDSLSYYLLISELENEFNVSISFTGKIPTTPIEFKKIILGLLNL